MGRQPSAKRPLLLLAKVAKSGRANEGMKKERRRSEVGDGYEA